MRLPHANPDRIPFHWNGRRVEARLGDSIASALYANGIRLLVRSRKRHRPQGLSGSFIGPVLGRVNGRPNVRLDLEPVAADMDVRMQNVWPRAGLDLFALAQLLPARWLHGGFEHTNLIPSGTHAFQRWERLLSHLAGVADPPDKGLPAALRSGRRVVVDTLVVGGGPSGCSAAGAAAERGERVALVSRGESPGRFARALGVSLPELDDRIEILAGMEVFGLYREGALVGCAPPHHDHGAVVVETGRVVLATGRRSCPPLVPGNDLPGVLDAHTALMLAQDHAVAPGRSVVVIGTGAEKEVAQRLRELGVRIVATGPAQSVRRIRGRRSVIGVELDRTVACDCVVHAGPWRADPNLAFQARAEGLLQLRPGAQRGRIEIVGAAAEPDEPVVLADGGMRKALVCACMDVTAGEVLHHVEAGETDVEVLKRLTSCGMGPCQGNPCWELMAALVGDATGTDPASLGRPSHRDPRRALTVAQAAGLDGLVEVDR